MTEVQRRSDEAAFTQYAAVRDLRSAAMQMALAVGEANTHGAAADEEVQRSEHALVLAAVAVQETMDDATASERALLREQLKAPSALAELAHQAAEGGNGAALEVRRDVLIERFVAANDELLTGLAAERREARRSAARRPVILVLAFFLLFAFVHLLVVERPAHHERRRRRARGEFVDALQVARSEAEAYDVLARHVDRVAGALHVTVLNRNNSDDRLEAVTPVRDGSLTAEGLDGAAPDSCLAIRLARPHHRAPGDEPLLRCGVCGMSAEQTTCVPSLVGGEVIGAVLVEHHGPLARERRGDVEQSVTEAAPVVANLRNLAVAELRAATDGLTGLANQRTVHEALKRAAAQAGRTASALALVLFDLDHFKAINDTHGHSKGDEVLAAVGATALSTIRTSDFVGRLGGEEFALVLPATDRAGGVEAAEKLRAAIATISVPGVERPITASFGVAVMPDDAGEPAILLREADRALYAAKRAGRDRVETIGDTTASTHPEAAAGPR
ncbi:MAG TPA: GGDEF domain-containing protein [Baekduia sp.]|nr:GGDEF domain-containing protein [Baekduia sp.]